MNMTEIPFNLNHNVRFKPLAGYEKARAEYYEFLDLEAPPPKPVDAKGYATDQLWCLMQEVGHAIGCGVTDVIETKVFLTVDAPAILPS